MRQIKNWIMRLSIRKKMIFYTYLIIVPIILLISAFLLWHNSEAALRREEETCISGVQGLSDNIEALQKNIIEMGTYISINYDITQILTADNPEVLNEDSRLWVHNAPMQMIQDVMALSGQIKTIAIYPENGVNPYLRCMDSSSYIRDMDEVREQEIYRMTVEAKGKNLWKRVGKYQSDTFQSNRSDKIVMYREIYDLTKKNKLGYLCIGASTNKFDEICRNALRDDAESVVVVSGHGEKLFCSGEIKNMIVDDVISLDMEYEEESDILCRSYGEYNVYCCLNEETGIRVYKFVLKSVTSDVLRPTILVLLTIMIGLLICIYPIMAMVSAIVSKPLRTLSAEMEKFKQGDFSQRIEVTTLDEIGEACIGFNSMVDDIRNLINKNYVLALKEKESELDVLQAQINPHFLYNTLDALYWKALEAGAEDIGEDVLALSQMFRLVLNRGNSIVTVRSESELLDRYLYIQKMRFGKRLEYKISIEEELLEEEIPKLILQPFVENAIVHGFEKGEDQYSLFVTGEKKENRMVFYVRDTGVGMSKEQVAAIWDTSDTRKYASQRIGKYAIKNVRERLKLTYYDDFKLEIESEEGKGTSIMISVPCGLKEGRVRGN